MKGTIDTAIYKDVLDQLLAGCDPEELIAKNGLLDELKKALSEWMLSAELDDHLENEGAAGTINRRNGSSKKTTLTGTSKVTLDVPRDRAGTFDPKLIAKYQYASGLPRVVGNGISGDVRCCWGLLLKSRRRSGDRTDGDHHPDGTPTHSQRR